MKLTAVIAACLLAAGVLRHYWDIYVFQTVRGISFIFVALDAAGDLFSLISLGYFPWRLYWIRSVFQPQFDIFGSAIYGTELALWIGIMMCGVIFNLREWLKSNNRGQDLELPEGISNFELCCSSCSPQAKRRCPNYTRLIVINFCF